MTPDGNPFIDKHPNYANIILASGFSGKTMIKTLHLPVHVLFCARHLLVLLHSICYNEGV